MEILRDFFQGFYGPRKTKKGIKHLLVIFDDFIRTGCLVQSKTKISKQKNEWFEIILRIPKMNPTLFDFYDGEELLNRKFNDFYHQKEIKR